MTVHRLLVTAPGSSKMDVWLATAIYSNWIEGRKHRKHKNLETWIVTVFDEDKKSFLEAASASNVTVEEITHTGDTEIYNLLIGKPGTGWSN